MLISHAIIYYDMCYSTTSSILGWSFSIIIGCLMYRRNKSYDRPLAAFIIAFSFIQLIEAFAHDDPNNRYTGYLMMWFLWLQCFVFNYQLYVYFYQIGHPMTNLSLQLAILFGIVLFSSTMDLITTSDEIKIVKAPSGHLAWLRGNNGYFLGSFGWLYLLGIFAPLVMLMISHKDEIKPYILTLYAFMSFIYSMKITHNTNFIENATFSSMWCFLAAGFSLLAYII